MNRRKFLSFALVLGLPAIAFAQASKAENKKKCAEEGHLIGDPIKRTEFRTKHPLCTKVLLSSTCPGASQTGHMTWCTRVSARRIRKPAEC